MISKNGQGENKNEYFCFFHENPVKSKARTVVGVKYLHKMAVMQHQMIQGAIKP